MSIGAAPPPQQLPDSSSPATGREPVLAASIAFLVLAVGVTALGFFAYQTLDLGATEASTPVRSAAPAPEPGEISVQAIAFVDSLEIEVTESGSSFVVTATAHIGSEPAILPEGDITVLATLLGPEREYELEGLVDERGNVGFEQEVDDSGIYSIAVRDIQGEGLSYDPLRDDAALASVRAGDDDGPGVEERTVEDAETESSDPVDTHTTSSEVDSGVEPIDTEPEPDPEPSEPEPEPSPGAFDDINDDLFGDGEEEPPPANPDDGESPFVPPGSDGS